MEFQTKNPKIFMKKNNFLKAISDHKSVIWYGT